MGRKFGGGLWPFKGGELGPNLTQYMARAEAYLRAEFHLDSSNRLATVHQRHRQDRQTDGTTDRQHRAKRFTNGRRKTG